MYILKKKKKTDSLSLRIQSSFLGWKIMPNSYLCHLHAGIFFLSEKNILNVDSALRWQQDGMRVGEKTLLHALLPSHLPVEFIYHVVKFIYLVCEFIYIIANITTAILLQFLSW